eukprot:TRINITY_DN3018_c0_g1_i2.p1 TRINITY_DN3018_c0_g1~~TRINITY_DN3018_c0_g1_i2.p1  ORF type:complete len:231 (-),score=38.22 TRINITY_DN3018_c0_g1_i2:584-1276(-)
MQRLPWDVSELVSDLLVLQAPGQLAAISYTERDSGLRKNQTIRSISVALDSNWNGRTEREKERKRQRRVKQKAYKKACEATEREEAILQASVEVPPSDEQVFMRQKQPPPPEPYMQPLPHASTLAKAALSSPAIFTAPVSTKCGQSYPDAAPPSPSTFMPPMYVKPSQNYSEVDSPGTSLGDAVRHCRATLKYCRCCGVLSSSSEKEARLRIGQECFMLLADNHPSTGSF